LGVGGFAFLTWFGYALKVALHRCRFFAVARWKVGGGSLSITIKNYVKIKNLDKFRNNNYFAFFNLKF
jgi:hypothetical protein